MTDLSEYDKAIVEAAEVLVAARHNPGDTVARAEASNNLERVVQAKREAQKPQCDYRYPNLQGQCNKAATERSSWFTSSYGQSEFHYRCADHAVTVTHL